MMIQRSYVFLFFLLGLTSASMATISDEENFGQHRTKSAVASRSNESLSPLETLPREVIVNVLAYLDIPALKKTDSACWTLHQAAEVLWKDEAKALAKEWKVHPPFADGAEDHQWKHIAIVLKAAEECYKHVKHIKDPRHLADFMPLERAASLDSVRAMEKYLNYCVLWGSDNDFLSPEQQLKVTSYLAKVINYYQIALRDTPIHRPFQYKVARYIHYRDYLFFCFVKDNSRWVIHHSITRRRNAFIK